MQQVSSLNFPIGEAFDLLLAPSGAQEVNCLFVFPKLSL